LRGNHSEFFSKKVRASFSNCDHNWLSDFLERKERLAQRRLTAASKARKN